jgi:hypothetical protein
MTEKRRLDLKFHKGSSFYIRLGQHLQDRLDDLVPGALGQSSKTRLIDIELRNRANHEACEMLRITAFYEQPQQRTSDNPASSITRWRKGFNGTPSWWHKTLMTVSCTF